MNDHNSGGQPTFRPRTRSQRVGPSGTRSSRVSRKAPQKPWKRFFNKKWFMLVGLTSFLLILGGCSALFFATKSNIIPLEKVKNMKFASDVLDHKGNPVTQIGAARLPMDIEKVREKNPDLLLAFVKVEDERFYKHNGVDFYGLARAIAKDIMCLCMKEGASTITMQVAGNVVLEDRDKNFTRKFREMAAAFALENKYDKDKILEAYLNYISFGNGVQGVKLASLIYFGKDPEVDELDKHEIALLAGLPKAPYGYNPYGTDKQKKKALERRNTVLFKMTETEQGLEQIITREEAEQLKKKPLGVDKKHFETHFTDKSQYAAYEDAVIKEALERFPDEIRTRDDLQNGGYKIYTGMDQEAQDAMLKAISTENELLGDETNPLDGAATMIDAKTGLVKAISGGKRYKPTYLHWGLQPIQPGSTVKPLAVYSPIMEKNPKQFHPNATYVDKKIKLGTWEPKNFDGEEKGKVTLRKALAHSYNLTPAWIVYKDLKVDYPYQKLQELGFKHLQEGDKNVAPLSLGGFTDGVTTLEMAQAYSVYPNMGVRKKARFIDKIVTKDGEVLTPKDIEDEEIDQNGTVLNEDEEPLRIFQPQTVWWSIVMMRDVFEYGTASQFKIDGLDTAGKTGTTQEAKAGWMVGFTSDTVLAVTVFNGQTEDGKTGKEDVGKRPHTLWKEIMTNAKIKSEPMKKPSGVSDPPEPVELGGAKLNATYNAESGVVDVSWKIDSRANYELLRRSQDGDWEPIHSGSGSGSYSDQAPYQSLLQSGQEAMNFEYKLIVRDPQAADSEGHEVTDSVQVTLPETDVPEEEPDCEEDPNAPGCKDKDEDKDCKDTIFGRDCKEDPGENPPEDPQGDDGKDKKGRDGWNWGYHPSIRRFAA